MTEHTVGTREEWNAAREALLAREREEADLHTEIAEQRRALPWVPVEKEYVFETEDGRKTLAELFDGRSQLLIYHLMYGPDWAAACPGCTSVGDELDGMTFHLGIRDVTLMCVSRAPIEKLAAYKERMGWRFPWASAYAGDFNFDFGYALTPAQLTGVIAPNGEEVDAGKLIAEAPDWLREHAESVGAPDLASSLADGPGWSAFALSGGIVLHTYASHPPLVVPLWSQLLDYAPMRVDAPLRRKDES